MNAAVLPDLATYQQYLGELETALGRVWAPQDGITNGTNFALPLPSAHANLVPAEYPRLANFHDYRLVLPATPPEL